MATRIIRDFLDGKRARARWIEYDAYARRVFANSAADWLTQSTRFANTLIQAQKAVRSEVITVDLVLPGMETWAESRPAEPLAACQSALTQAGAHRFVVECVDAIQHKLGREIDFFIRFPSPRDFLVAAGQVNEPEFDALDDLSSALVAAIREFSGKAISGILMTREAAIPLSADEVDAYGAIFNAVKHYGWVTAVALHPDRFVDGVPTIDGVDIVLGAEVELSRLRELRGAKRGVGGGLTRAWWRDNAPVAETDSGDLLFGFIPEDANPEAVLNKCAALAR